MENDESFHRRRLESRMHDPEFRREYERARTEIDQVDAVMQQLDSLRQENGLSKADLARAIGKNPATLRRLFSAEVNPELKTVAALASALDADIQIVSRKHSERVQKHSPIRTRLE